MSGLSEKKESARNAKKISFWPLNANVDGNDDALGILIYTVDKLI